MEGDYNHVLNASPNQMKFWDFSKENLTKKKKTGKDPKNGPIKKSKA